MSDDPRVVARLAAHLLRAGRTYNPADAARFASLSIHEFEHAGLAVVLKDNFPGPDLVWDIGDPEPPADVLGVFDFTHEDHDDILDPDSDHWGRTASGWKGYKNGFKQYLNWPELVRRWGPVRRG